MRSRAPALILAAAIALTGCATLRHRHAPPGIPIERRPTPPQPAASDTVVVPPPDTTTFVKDAAPAPKAAPNAPAPDKSAAEPPPASPPVEAAMSPEERKASRERIVADTTAASSAVRKCSGKDLLPDQETVYETTRSLLAQARAAISRDELWRAESLARKARQLASSLDCH